MGNGRWSTNVYDERDRLNRAAGKGAFDYNDSLHRSGRETWRVHPSLDPHGVAARESRDTDEHPNSTAIAVLFDVTGSMGQVPVVLQQKLPQLLGLLLREAYVPDPQILFGAIGDATCDVIPLQVGQFESDNRMDENLENIFLEGGGGGQQTESYELAMYFMARHTQIDCWEKRGQKGFLFIVGDEMAYGRVDRAEVAQHIADGLGEPIATAAIVKELQRRYHVFYLLPKAASYGGDPNILGFWRKLLGQQVIELDDAEAVCETIALSIGLMAGAIDLRAGIEDLKQYNVKRRTLDVVSNALANLPARPAAATSSAALGGGKKEALPSGTLQRL